jgi:hypothetical protein
MPMAYRMGGEFELTPELFLQPVQTEGLWPYGTKNVIHVDTGRSALLLALLDILRRGGKKKAWLPRYCCESVIQPFIQLGFDIQFYSMGENLQTPDCFFGKLHGDTILLIHYFGKRNESMINHVETLRKQEQCFVIEDCVQAGLSSGVGLYGDYAIYSYRKFLPQPDGGVLISKEPVDPVLADPDESFITQKTIAKIIRGVNGDPNLFLGLFEASEQIIDGPIIPRQRSWLSGFLFERSDLQRISSTRKANWQYLAKSLQDSNLAGTFIHPIFTELLTGEVPLGFPIKIDPQIRADLRKYLISQNIFCPVHWPIQDDGRWPKETALASSMLTLPIDQRVDSRALDFMLEVLKSYFRGNV